MRSSLPGTSTPPPAAEPTPNAPSSSASTASHDQTGRPGQTPGPWEIPPRVEYRLTPVGEGLREVLDAMATWALSMPEQAGQGPGE
ncbi:winged helix-turn-helix transcriptional regulator [Streptomyces acidiscabies]|uniref:winged helix-turn-helix transcriptional regulator n=1 Tax=Streptomyces acidiscabies TaxID=42234 RepID=UPI0027DEB983|nr:winged helix-turn-helix transcriptional regulator [Streptomyces acidiscabies]MBZ3913434.1 helix-turn-helix transcriptional regulator [Streptomyces acidiscabies]